jgi:hypothetical protein
MGGPGSLLRSEVLEHESGESPLWTMVTGDENPLKNGFAAAQKSFPLRGRPDVIMIHGKPLT